MRTGPLVLGLFLAITPVFPQARIITPAVPMQRSISSSKQFVIYFSDGAVRSRLALKAEDIKREWLRCLKQPDEWKAPIIIQVVTTRPANTPAMTTNLFESDGGELKVQIDVYEPSVLKGVDFEMELYRALGLEAMYRQAPPKAGKAITQPPAWLLEGMHEDAATRESGIPAGLFEMLIRSGPPPKLEAFLKLRPERMDATSRAVYRAQSMGLLRALISLPKGAENLAKYLASLPGGNPADAAKLLENFPQFADQPAELSKVWTLSMANASAVDRMKPLSMADSRKQLAVLMDITAQKDPKKAEAGLVIGPEALQAIARSESGRYILRQKAEELLRLELRSHPVMKPIVEEYRIIAMQLAEKPGKNFEKRIRKNMELQAAVADRTVAIEDYLNWFEATQLTTPSKEFDAMLDRKNKTPAFQRSDSISRLLNDYEARGW